MHSPISPNSSPTPRLASRVVGTALCCLLAVSACFAEDSTASKASSQTAAESPDAAGAQRVSELSVPPLVHKIYPDDRPQWISAEPTLEGSLHRWPVVSLPSLSAESSQENLAAQKQIAVGAYIDHLTGSDGKASRAIRFDDEYIDARLVDSQRTYRGVVTVSDGEMVEHAAELVFDEAFRDEVLEQWRRVEVGERLTGLGVLGAGGLILLVGLSSVLKVFHRVKIG